MDGHHGTSTASILDCNEAEPIRLSRPARFGHLELDLEQIEQCITLVRLLMVRTNAVESMALEEEVGFREFCGWVKFGEHNNLA